MKVVLQMFRRDPGRGRLVEELRAAFPEVTFEPASTVEEQRIAVRDAEVYYGFMEPEVYEAAEKLRWIQLPGAGIDTLLELPGLVDSDIVVTNTRGPHVNSMADHAVGMMVILAHSWMDHFEDQRARRWGNGQYIEKQIEISGSTMGILGLGGVGGAIARRAHGFGMRVYAVDNQSKPTTPAVRMIWGMDRLDDLLGESDWFVVAAPLTPETRGLIDRRRVELLKEGARVIVVSRGGIVDEPALIDGLRSGRIAGAGMDVFAQEPLPEDSPLWDMPNVVMTPHCSGVTTAVLGNVEQVFQENLRRYLATEPFLYVCDKKAGF